MKTWTINQILACRPCAEYTRERLESLAGTRESITALEVLDLDIPLEDRIWLSCRGDRADRHAGGSIAGGWGGVGGGGVGEGAVGVGEGVVGVVGVGVGGGVVGVVGGVGVGGGVVGVVGGVGEGAVGGVGGAGG